MALAVAFSVGPEANSERFFATAADVDMRHNKQRHGNSFFKH